MTRLVLLNGPPGVGKSTLARRWVEQHPLALCLDVDLLRRQLGQWADLEQESGTLARALSLAAAREHLGAGHDVVVPQFLARPEFADALQALAREVGARFSEVVLLASPPVAEQRFRDRAGEGHAGESAQALERAGGYALAHAALLDLLATRAAGVIESADLDQDVLALEALLDDGPGAPIG